MYELHSERRGRTKNRLFEIFALQMLNNGTDSRFMNNMETCRKHAEAWGSYWKGSDHYKEKQKFFTPC